MCLKTIVSLEYNSCIYMFNDISSKVKTYGFIKSEEISLFSFEK